MPYTKHKFSTSTNYYNKSTIFLYIQLKVDAKVSHYIKWSACSITCFITVV